MAIKALEKVADDEETSEKYDNNTKRKSVRTKLGQVGKTNVEI